MLDIEGSLKYRGKAVVAETKATDSWVIKMIPIEMSGDINGEFDGGTGTRYHRYVNSKGVPEDNSCEYTQVVPAKWYKTGNRTTAPDVTLGETVHLYEFEDTRVYFWKEDPRSDHYRCLEHIEFLLSNVSDITDDAEHLSGKTDKNAYQITLSTLKKRLGIKTNKFDGEPFEHILELLTKEATFRYKDDAGLLIEANSIEDFIVIKTQSGAYVRIDKFDITVYAGNVTVNADNVVVNASTVEVNADQITSTATLIDAPDAAANFKTVHATHPHLNAPL